jgi:hypothetical protein
MRASYVRVTALLTITALCACSGGGSSPSNPIPARAPVATSSAPANTSSQTRATFVIHWPSGAQAAAATKRRKTISPSTQSISVTVNGGSPTVVNKPTLTGSPSTTSVTIYAPPGDDGFTFTAWDQLDASGAILDQATVNQTIIADANNTVSVALDGVCAALVPTLTQTGVYVQYQNETVPLASGSRTVLKSARLIGNFSKVFQFTRVDADGNTILTSAGSAPILVTESGSTQHVTIVPVATGASNTTFTITPTVAEPDGFSTSITAESPTCGTGTSTLPNSFALSTAAEVIVADANNGILAYDQDGTSLAKLSSKRFTFIAYSPNSKDLVAINEDLEDQEDIDFQTLSLSGSSLGSGSFVPQGTDGTESPSGIIYNPVTGNFYFLVEYGDENPEPNIEEYSISGSTATYVAYALGYYNPGALIVLPNGNLAVSQDDENSDTCLFSDTFFPGLCSTGGVNTALTFDSTRGYIIGIDSTGGTIFDQSLNTVGVFNSPTTVDHGYPAAYSPGNDELYIFNGGNAVGMSGSTIYQGGSTTSNLPAGAFPQSFGGR